MNSQVNGSEMPASGLPRLHTGPLKGSWQPPQPPRTNQPTLVGQKRFGVFIEFSSSGFHNWHNKKQAVAVGLMRLKARQRPSPRSRQAWSCKFDVPAPSLAVHRDRWHIPVEPWRGNLILPLSWCLSSVVLLEGLGLVPRSIERTAPCSVFEVQSGAGNVTHDRRTGVLPLLRLCGPYITNLQVRACSGNVRIPSLIPSFLKVYEVIVGNSTQPQERPTGCKVHDTQGVGCHCWTVNRTEA